MQQNWEWLQYSEQRYVKNLARPEGLEPPTYWFEASRSIHLS